MYEGSIDCDRMLSRFGSVLVLEQGDRVGTGHDGTGR